MKAKHIERRYIKKYLERHFKYDTENKRIYSQIANDTFFGYSIINEIVSVFGFSRDRVQFCVKKWTESLGIDWDEINPKWRSVQVEAGERRIRAQWNPELLAQDLAAYHQIDAVAELEALLANELANEIDADMIGYINNVADNQDLARNNDINYFRDNLIRNIGIPREYFGFNRA